MQNDTLTTVDAWDDYSGRAETGRRGNTRDEPDPAEGVALADRNSAIFANVWTTLAFAIFSAGTFMSWTKTSSSKFLYGGNGLAPYFYSWACEWDYGYYDYIKEHPPTNAPTQVPIPAGSTVTQAPTHASLAPGAAAKIECPQGVSVFTRWVYVKETSISSALFPTSNFF